MKKVSKDFSNYEKFKFENLKFIFGGITDIGGRNNNGGGPIDPPVILGGGKP